MEIFEICNEVNKLLPKIQESQKTFLQSIEKVETFKDIITYIFKCFGDCNYNEVFRKANPVLGKYNLMRAGIVAVDFNWESSAYSLLKETSKEELTSILNLYSPLELEVQDILIGVNDLYATVIVSLKGLDI